MMPSFGREQGRSAVLHVTLIAQIGAVDDAPPSKTAHGLPREPIDCMGACKDREDGLINIKGHPARKGHAVPEHHIHVVALILRKRVIEQVQQARASAHELAVHELLPMNWLCMNFGLGPHPAAWRTE